MNQLLEGFHRSKGIQMLKSNQIIACDSFAVATFSSVCGIIFLLFLPPADNAYNYTHKSFNHSNSTKQDLIR